MHQEDVAGDTLLLQPPFEPPEVGFHQRFDIGVGDHGVEPLVLAHLRRHLGGDRDHDARQTLLQHLADHPLMGVVQVGVDQPDGDALITRFGDTIRQSLDLGPVERQKYGAGSIDALFHRVTHLARQQRFGQVEVQIILLEPAFGAHLDHVAEALGRDQRRLGPAPLD